MRLIHSLIGSNKPAEMQPGLREIRLLDTQHRQRKQDLTIFWPDLMEDLVLHPGIRKGLGFEQQPRKQKA